MPQLIIARFSVTRCPTRKQAVTHAERARPPSFIVCVCRRTTLLAQLAKAKTRSSPKPDSDGMGSIPAIPDARNVPLLFCHERFNEANPMKPVCVEGGRQDFACFDPSFQLHHSWHSTLADISLVHHSCIIARQSSSSLSRYGHRSDGGGGVRGNFSLFAGASTSCHHFPDPFWLRCNARLYYRLSLRLQAAASALAITPGKIRNRDKAKILWTSINSKHADKVRY